ncbi:MAG TPA: XrtA system polysaccharide deacetylase [Gemmatimonadales bacterium]|nr:XrtA system polysaccharide deacetylase [Gemmatimonadales bacterium]
MRHCVLTFDIEEWFQVENLRAVFPRASWEDRPRRVVQSTRAVLDLLESHGVRATFFVLGWVAERNPGLVRDIVAGRHEVACHGYGHVLPMQLTEREFRDDVTRGRQALEDITGAPVVGYRAPSFSISERHLAILAEYGFRYDSSFHPFSLHRRYGRLAQLGARLRPGIHRTEDGLIELALPVERFGAASFPVSGGGYFRVLPAGVFRYLVERAIVRDGHYVMYLHSWEFDPAQPRVTGVRIGDRFRHYHNLARTLPRMHRLIPLLKDLETQFATATDFIDEIASGAAVPARPRAAHGH